MICFKIKKKENWKKIIGYTIPIIATIAVFVGMLIGHKTQEFGNFDFENNYTVDMSKVNVQSEIDFSNDKSKKQVYKTKILTRDEAREIALDVFKKMGKENDSSSEVEQENLVRFKPLRKSLEENDAALVVYYIGGKYGCSNSSWIYVGENGEVQFVKKINNANREEIEAAFKKLGISVPVNAEFSYDNKREQYVFSMNMVMQDNKLIDGEIRCDYYIDKSIKYFENNIVTYDIVGEKELKSEQDAYQEILKGKFKGFTIDEIKNINVKGIELEYQIDSKGYYVPVYKFDVLLNGNKNRIYIKAIK